MPFQPSNYASTFLGGLDTASNKQKAAFGSAALRARARMKAAELGAEVAADNRRAFEQQQAANRSAAFGQTLLGLAGNIGSSAFGALGAERARLNDRYGSPSMTPYGGPLPSTTSDFAKPPPPPPVSGFAASSGQSFASGLGNLANANYQVSAPIFKPSTSYF